ncbi:hypothetical protein GCM10010420_55420 [Streptomyces glaucosporus]|uniref:Uncharacterized protein n=1 Tax=Streptomyces glaucosporus TaxID=284044 RepID=A0ABP5W2D6_9ACTN
MARQQLVGDDVVGSDCVAYRAAVPIERVRENGITGKNVTVYVGPRCHFVQYALRGEKMFNQVAVFESPKALAGREDWGTPDELDAAFADTCDNVSRGIPLMWRDRWWRMFDRDPIGAWVHGRIARQSAGNGGRPDWDAAPVSYEAVRVEHCRRVVTTARAWGELWHLDGTERLRRNAIMRARDVRDYGFTDWVYGPTALTPDEEPSMFTPIPPASARIEEVREAESAGAGTGAARPPGP